MSGANFQAVCDQAAQSDYWMRSRCCCSRCPLSRALGCACLYAVAYMFCLRVCMPTCALLTCAR
eukprot:3502718-Rhodomonas_salina.2